MKQKPNELRLIGADPELFVYEARGGKGRKYISAHIFGCGTKEQPMPIPHGSVQVDGLALEFNVIPSNNRDQFISNVEGAMKDLKDIVSRHGNFGLAAVPSVPFSYRYLSRLPKKTRELGCNPDYNAYTMNPNQAPDSKTPMRTGAGHVHIGWTQEANVRDYQHFTYCCELAKQLDYFLGLPSLNWDQDNRRRSLYGNAGAFRPKAYGMEYRVLSNAWLSKPELSGIVFEQTQKALQAFDNGNRLNDRFPEVAREHINNNDPTWTENFPEIYKEVRYA